MAGYPPDFDPNELRGIGTWGAILGSGQHRFMFVPRQPSSQVELFDRVAGLLHREIESRFFIRALYLYPPDEVNESGHVQAVMLLLGQDESGEAGSEADAAGRALNQEYERLGRMVIAELADLSEDHHPRI